MSNLNKAILIGRLGSDPHHHVSQSGLEVSSFSLAVSEKNKEKQEETQWFKVTFFGKQAQISQQYLKKGSLVYVEGRIKLEKYNGKDGTEKAMIAIVGDKFTMLGSKSESGETKENGDNYRGTANAVSNKADLDDDIPF